MKAGGNEQVRAQEEAEEQGEGERWEVMMSELRVMHPCPERERARHDTPSGALYTMPHPVSIF